MHDKAARACAHQTLLMRYFYSIRFSPAVAAALVAWVLMGLAGCKRSRDAAGQPAGPLPVNVVAAVEKEVTEWDEFRALDLQSLARAMRGKVLVDLRNVYDRAEAERAGLTYFGVGRGRPQGT